MNGPTFWILFLLGWFVASLIVGLIAGKVIHGFNDEFDHADMIDRAREQMRRELR
jgi:putative exporter of polyketide antibiotics